MDSPKIPDKSHKLSDPVQKLVPPTRNEEPAVESKQRFVLPTRKEEPAGEPVVPLPVPDTIQLSVGDHVLYLTGSEEYRQQYRSALVSSIDHKEKKVQIITFTKDGIVESWYYYSDLPHLHRIVYSKCQFTPEEAVLRAHHRKGLGDKHYHPFNNNGHHFVSNVKTGREYGLSDIIVQLETQTQGKHVITQYNVPLKQIKIATLRERWEQH